MCDLLRLCQDVPSNLVDNRRPPKHIVAWFHSSRISFSTRMSIDKAIVKLREKGRIAKILDTFAGEEIPDGCTLRIDWILLALLHVIIIGVPLAGFPISMVCFSIGRRRRSKTGIDGNKLWKVVLVITTIEVRQLDCFRTNTTKHRRFLDLTTWRRSTYL